MKIIETHVTNEHGEAVLFLQNAANQKIQVAVQNVSDQPVALGEPDAASGSQPNDRRSDFKILFRPRTLLRPENIKLSKVTLVTNDSTKKPSSIDDTPNWLSLEDAAKTPGNSSLDQPSPVTIPSGAGPHAFVTLSLTRLRSLNLNPRDLLKFELSNINPDVNDGARVTRVETKFDLRSGNTPLQGSALNYLNLVHTTGQALGQSITSAKVGPFAAAFQGHNKVVNVGQFESGLKIRFFINPESVPGGQITVTKDSLLELSFDEWTPDKPYGLVRAKDGVTCVIQETSGEGRAAVWRNGADGRTANRVGESDATWFKESFLDFNLKVFSDAPSGFAALKIAWKGLPDFADAELVLLAELGPTFVEEFVEEAGFPPRTKGLATTGQTHITGTLLVDGNTGIIAPTTRVPVPTPSARLSVVASGANETKGNAMSNTLRCSSGVLGSNPGDELSLASLGYQHGPSENSIALGIRGRCVATTGNFDDTSIGLGLDVDNNVRVAQFGPSQPDAYLWLRGGGNIGIGTPTPAARLQVGNGAGGGQLLIFSDDSGQLQIHHPTDGPGSQATIGFSTGLSTSGFPTFANQWLMGSGAFGLGAKKFALGPPNRPLVSVREDGNVGVGNTDPTTKVQVGAGEGGGKVSIFSDNDDFGQLQIGNPKSAEGDEASMCFVTGLTAFGSNPGTTDTGHKWSIGNSAFGLARRFVIGYGNGDSNFGPKLTIRRAGNVGIGTEAPEAKLHVVNVNQDAQGNTLILGPTNQSNLRLGYDQDFSWIQSHFLKPLAINSLGNNVGIGPGMTNPSQQLHVKGNILATGNVQAANVDLAENYYSDQDLAAGDVVCIDKDQDRIVLSEQAHDDLVLGIISTKPGVLLNSDPDAQPPQPGWMAHPVALCGRVPCKVTDENGPIGRGDLLTSSSTPGHAMKALPIDVAGQKLHRQGTIVGKALAPLKSGKGVIDIFVCLR